MSENKKLTLEDELALDPLAGQEEIKPAFKSDKVLKCPMCGKPMCVMDKMDDIGYNSDTPDIVERVIIFEYNCSNPECGMSGYYPFEVSEVPDGESFFE